MTVYRLDTLPEEANKFVFDTNVLIYLHGFTGTYKNHDYKKKMRDYSLIANNIISEQSNVYIDLVALSEFVNVYINEALAYKLNVNPKDFKFRKKDHRNLPEYQDVIDDLKSVINQIMTNYNIHIVKDGYDDFDVNSLTKILPLMEFNDHLITLVAKKYDSFLVTNDKDIINNCSDINVVTAVPA